MKNAMPSLLSSPTQSLAKSPVKSMAKTLAILSLAILPLAYAAASTSKEVSGTVQRFLMNPEGDVDGFLLGDGTQVNFPPHMASQLTAVIAANDTVQIKGQSEAKHLFKADSITNSKTQKTVTETPPQPPARPPLLPGDVAGNPPPPGPGGPRGPHHREGLQQLTAQGKIENQLFGRRGEVNGVILSDGAIVHFGPRLMDDSKVKMDVGQNIQVSGFGTKNANGVSIEGTEVKN